MQALRLVDLYTSKGFDLKSKRIYIKVRDNSAHELVTSNGSHKKFVTSGKGEGGGVREEGYLYITLVTGALRV